MESQTQKLNRWNLTVSQLSSRCSVSMLGHDELMVFYPFP